MDEELRNIERELESITGGKKRGKKGKNKGSKNFKFLENLKIENAKLVPLLIFVILFFIKPEFLYDNDIEKKEKVFSYIKLFVFTLIFSVIVFVVINYEKIIN